MSFPSAADVIREIELAFDGVKRGNGVTLHEADVIDDYGTDEQRRTARTFDTDLKWQEVPGELIERFSCQLSFLDAEGFHYYIPAYMRWVLANYEKSGSPTVDSTIYQLEYAADQLGPVFNALPLLTDAQKRSVASFLLHMSTAERFTDAAHATRALERFWLEYVS